MKLYYAPGACSMASHIILHEVGRPFTTDRVNVPAKETSTGADYRAVNANGMVPALETPEGVLTEGAAIVQFVADSGGRDDLTGGAPGTMTRARVQEMLNFVASELHKAYSPLFRPGITDEAKAAQFEVIKRKLGWIEAALSDGRAHLTGAAFTVADAYAFVVSGWSGAVGLDLAPFPHVTAWRARVAGRASVLAAMRDEGLLKAA